MRSEYEELQSDLILLDQIQASRKDFLDLLCRESQSVDANVTATLRLESTYQLAQFLYLLKAMDITSEAQIAHFAELHNDYMVTLSNDPARIARYGLTSDRILDAIFTADTLPRLLNHWREQPGTIDQSNLARFLVTLMSAESCRKIIVACEAAGFVARERGPGGTVLIKSLGVLESLYGSCLRSLKHKLFPEG